MSFFKRSKSQASISLGGSKSKEQTPLTPLQILVGDAPVRADGSDKFFGFENYGNTCYCNSIMQCLYNSKPFRQAVVEYPQRSVEPGVKSPALADSMVARATRNPPNPITNAQRRPSVSTAQSQTTTPTLRVEDKESPEYKKKVALSSGPVLNVELPNSEAYGMEETLFSALKDLFESMVSNESRTGVVSPQKFVEVLKLKNELFRSQMHQDAHEFLNYLLNEVVENVEEYAKKNPLSQQSLPNTEQGASLVPRKYVPPDPIRGWVHDLFEGALTSETKCLTCENISRRDEPFLDLSIDLEKHSSVTSCLRNFSASEMLCERNKFHCDGCGGLQEAEKRMKIRRLPKILALHLKRFKYAEELGRHQKLFHRVVYPYHLRLFNTTDDAEDPDRLYELYAIVVHIGGGPYHGHYVSIIKTEHKGWLLYDDEMVEPVDKSYVRNFFGDKPGLACAYVLFYQETTLEAVQKEEAAEQNAVPVKIPVELERPKTRGMNGTANGHARLPKASEYDEEAIDSRGNTPESPGTPNINTPTPLAKVPTIPLPKTPNGISGNPTDFAHRFPSVDASTTSPSKSKKEREREKKEEKEREKAAKKDEKDHNHNRDSGHGLARFRPGSMSMSGKKAFSWTGMKDKEKEKEKEKEAIPPTPSFASMDTGTNSLQSASAPLLTNTPNGKDKEKEREKERQREDREREKERERERLREEKEREKERRQQEKEREKEKERAAKEEKKRREREEKQQKEEERNTNDSRHHHHRLTLKKKLSILSSS